MIKYQVNPPVNPIDVAELYRDSGINRPFGNIERISQMVNNADLIVTAMDDDVLVGIARALTDWCYCCYLSDLAVAHKYQHAGIGSALLQRVTAEIGDSVTLVVVAAPDSHSFYERMGLTLTDQAFLRRRKR